MNTKKLFESETFHKVIIVTGLLLSALVIFESGVFVGVHKAGFSYRMGDNYYRAFGKTNSLSRGFGEELPSGHGVVGKILSVNLPTFVVADRENTEKTVRISTHTDIRFMRDIASTSALKPADFVVVIGSPNDSSEVEATLIRILPPPPGNGGMGSY